MAAKANKCAICGWQIPAQQGQTVRVDGKDVVVCCEECAQKARAARSAESAGGGKK